MPDSRLVGEREERLREAIRKLVNVENYWERERIARAALASSPSPPDREQQIQTIIDLIQREPGDARKLAEAIVAALFGRGDDAKLGDD